MAQITSRFLAILAFITISMIISSCGGGSGSGGIGDSGGTSSSSSSSGSTSSSSNGGGSTTDVLVTASGLNGTLSILVGNESRTFINDSTFNITGLPDDGSVQASITEDPDEQYCVFTSSNEQTAELAAQLTIECLYQINISFDAGVLGESDGEINNGTAILTVVSGETSENYELTATGANGIYLLEDYIVTGDETSAVIMFDAPGYTSASFNIQIGRDGADIGRFYDFPAYHTSQSIDPAAANDLTVDGATVSIPADSFRDINNNLPSGNITFQFSSIDPSVSAEFPGSPKTIPAGSTATRYFEFFGGFSITAYDANGAQLQLTNGLEITLSVQASSPPGQTAPDSPTAYVYNTETTYWDASDATFTLNGGNYEISIDKLGTWAPGSIYEHITITGCLRDSFNRVVTSSMMIAESENYYGRTISYPNQQGDFILYAKSGTRILVYGRGEDATQTVLVENQTDDYIIPGGCTYSDPELVAITLSWGQNPSDLDSHLTGPNGSGGRFLLYYLNKTETVNGRQIVLDVDDTTSYGPEVTTLTRLGAEGTYSFYVHLFAGTDSTFTSPTRVTRYYKKEEVTYTPATPDDTSCWHVFDIISSPNTDDPEVAYDATFVEQNVWVPATPEYCIRD